MSEEILLRPGSEADSTVSSYGRKTISSSRYSLASHNARSHHDGSNSFVNKAASLCLFFFLGHFFRSGLSYHR